MAKSRVQTQSTGDGRLKCGIVMPIGGFGDYAKSHWDDVLDIISQAADLAGLEANLVSTADEIGVIHKRILQNLYQNPIVICDVSGTNPNLMFELGLRLAFDKPTIIIKDHDTAYSFDTSPIEHLSYPRDLRYSSIVDFKEKLASKLLGTLEAASNADYSPFLKTFGEFTVPKLSQKEVGAEEYILEELRAIRSSLRRVENRPSKRNFDVSSNTRPSLSERELDICLAKRNVEERASLRQKLESQNFIKGLAETERDGHKHILLLLDPDNTDSRKRLDRILEDEGLTYRP